jgi:hypothetical protein
MHGEYRFRRQFWAKTTIPHIFTSLLAGFREAGDNLYYLQQRTPAIACPFTTYRVSPPGERADSMQKEAGAKSSVITFRVPQDVLEFIRQEAMERQVSLNTVVNQILTKHYEWDAFAEKYGFVSVSPEYYKGILDATDGKALEQRALQTAPQLRDYIRLAEKSEDVESMLHGFRIGAKYSGLGRLEMKREEPKYQLYLHHGFGEKHSLYVKNLLESIISSIVGTTPTSEMTANSVVIGFQTARARFVADLKRRKTAKEPKND